MKYLFNAEARKALLARIDTLEPATPARWGKMTAHDMVCHLIDHFNMVVNPRPVRVRKSIFLYQPFKWFAIYHAPIPRGMLKAPKEMRISKPDNWDQDIDRLKMLAGQFGAMRDKTDWPDNIMTGTMDGNSWSALLYRHTDHHLKQFGC
jgi:hypothetical protein